uniref:Uncharacterized protein LOC100183334 n=1 Tax=Phallusia mammillata TaxID=59560 RepID=A0A6F9DH51_9ASCI|nr:uncharacterized protein LOC100183334 [Phallusia mammillata]
MLLMLISGVLEWIVYALLLIVYLPIYILGYATIQKNLLVLKFRRYCGIKISTSKLGLVSRRSRVTDVLQVSTDEEIDFQANRSLAYVHRMALWTPRELVRTLFRQQTIELISNEQLAYVILSTVFAHSVVWDEEREMFRLKMEGFEDLFLFEGFYWDARHVLVSADGKRIVIQMESGEEFHSDCSQNNIHDYNLAKLHVQVCLSYFAPGLSHNHVHFVFPSAICLLSKKVLNRDGTLYKLLSPHFRFTERINYQALRVGKATNNKRSMLDRLFFLWQPFPVTKEQFLEGVARKCKRHYFDQGALNCDKDETGDDSPECSRRLHNLFPPDYVTDPELQKIPYLNFLRQYYLVVRKFVKSIQPCIDKDEWKLLAEAVAVHVPRFDKVNMVDAIATFIHQVGVVHFCDHNSYTRYFAYDYGSMAIRTPFETFNNEEHWADIGEQLSLNQDEIKKNPLLLIRQRDVMRTRCFLNIFVDYIPNSQCNLQLGETEYNFHDTCASTAANDFILQLRNLDENLKIQKHLLNDSASNREVRGVGMQIVPLKDIVRSVCY